MFCWFSIKTAINHPPTRFILNCFLTSLYFLPTGMDALISELKNGRVTLRRRQVTQETKNAALKELFEVLEHSQQQNRSSRTFLINHKYNLAQMETDNYQF